MLMLADNNHGPYMLVLIWVVLFWSQLFAGVFFVVHTQSPDLENLPIVKRCGCTRCRLYHGDVITFTASSTSVLPIPRAAVQW